MSKREWTEAEVERARSLLFAEDSGYPFISLRSEGTQGWRLNRQAELVFARRALDAGMPVPPNPIWEQFALAVDRAMYPTRTDGLSTSTILAFPHEVADALWRQFNITPRFKS